MNQERMYKVLMAPHVSEKGTRAADDANQHVFKVAMDATKPEIRQAVETLFSVKVTDVRVIKVKGKRKRHGVYQGRRPDWKKAVVRLRDGDDIDFLGTES